MRKIFIYLLLAVLAVSLVLAANEKVQGQGNNDLTGVDDDLEENETDDDSGDDLEDINETDENEDDDLDENETEDESDDDENDDLGDDSSNKTKMDVSNQEKKQNKAEAKQIRTEEKMQTKLQKFGNVSHDVDINESEDGKVHAKMSNGKNAEIKVMPETASARAIERLSLKVCSAENNCTIQLKEVGKGNETKMAYEVKAQKESRMLGIFKKKMEVTADVDAETGEVIKSHKPWWAFLAAE